MSAFFILSLSKLNYEYEISGCNLINHLKIQQKKRQKINMITENICVLLCEYQGNIECCEYQTVCVRIPWQKDNKNKDQQKCFL